MTNSATTTTTANPNALVYHAAAHGIASEWRLFVALGVAILVLMVVAEWRRQGRRSRRAHR